jgi:hypothetical protein
MASPPLPAGWEDASPDRSTVQGPTLVGQIKLQGLGPEGGLPFDTPVTVGAEQNDGFDNTLFNNHSMSIAGYDFTTLVPATPLHGNRDNFTATASGINVAWVASAPGDTSGFGQIMLQRYQIVVDEAGAPTGLVAAGIDGQVEDVATRHRTPADQAALDLQPGGAIDRAVQLVDADSKPAIGRDPVVTGLHTGETLV